MGVFDWLLKRETPAQRLARAREAIDEDEPERALKILNGLDGDEAHALMALARTKAGHHAPPRRHPQHPTFSDEAPPLPAPPDPDGDDAAARRTDGLAVARALVETLAAHPGPLEQPAYPFVEAVLLLARAGHAIPACANPARARLAEACVAAAARDVAKVIALGDRYAVPLARPIDPIAVSAIAPDDLGVLRAVAAIDRDRAAAMLAAMELEGPALGEATLAAIDLGLEPAALHARWPSLDGLSAEAAHPWRALEVRRLARVDLDAALAAEAALAQAWAHDADASLAVAGRLARHDRARALAHAVALPPHLDHVGWLRGCTRGDADDDVRALLSRWIANLSPATYDPYAYFRAVAVACLRVGDAPRLRLTCELGGPTGWQVAHATRWTLGRTAPTLRAELLATLYLRVDRGCVAARGVEPSGATLVAGHAVIRPPWLDLAPPAPHPIETLAIVAALGADGPAWFDDDLP